MKYCQHLHAFLNKVKNSYYALLCYALYSTLLCSAFLRSALLSSPLLYSNLIYSGILHHTILCICTLREPWAACPRIILQFSYNLHRKNNTRQSAQEFSSNYLITYIGKTTQHLVKELPECIPKTSKIPPKPPQKHPKMYPKSTLGAPLEPDLKKAP